VISRREFLSAAAATVVCPSAVGADAATAGGARVALVIGNDRYRHAPLASAANDARAIGELLRRAGFSVDMRVDATREAMGAAIDAFGAAAARRGVGLALFFYAGHAAQLDWRNYLLPVDGNVQGAGDVRAQCIDLGRVIDRLARARVKNAAIMLDACRDDPFGARFRPAAKGLSQYDAPAGALLAFATAPGRVAVELPGRRHGLYTEHLLRELPVPGVRIEDALKRVRLGVRMASGGVQVPWESTSLEADLVLFPAPRPGAAEVERRLRDELATWDRIKQSNRIEDWVDYLRRFPDGKFAEVAQQRLARLFAGAQALKGGGPGRPPLELGPGRPVPAALRRSDNPHSAGTFAFRPVWTVGDEYVFQVQDLYSGVAQRTFRFAVRKVDTAADRVEFSDGSATDLSGNPVRGEGRVFDPPLAFNPAELQVGRKWVSRFDQTGRVRGVGEYVFRVLDRQPIKVPAGAFSAFRVEGSGWFNPASGGTGGIRVTRWMVPGINVAVRNERFQFGDARVLVSARQQAGLRVGEG